MFNLVFVHPGLSSEANLGSYLLLDSLLFDVYYLTDHPDDLFRIDPYGIFIRPYGVPLRVMYDHLFDLIFGKI